MNTATPPTIEMQKAVYDVFEQMASAWPTHRMALLSNIEADVTNWAASFEANGMTPADVPALWQQVKEAHLADEANRRFPPNLTDFEAAWMPRRARVETVAQNERFQAESAARAMHYSHVYDADAAAFAAWLQLGKRNGWDK